MNRPSPPPRGYVDRGARRPKTVIDGIRSAGGVHCETSALQVLLSFAGWSLSEPMLFGLGGGLSFIYWDSKRQEIPFLGGRVKPFVLTQNVASRLGLDLHEQQTSSASRAWDQVRAVIDSGIPVGLQLDSHDLDYFTSRVHFAGHIVAMYGYDDEVAYLVDTAQQGGQVSTSRESLARARAARGPMSARHRSFTVKAPTSLPSTPVPIPAVTSAIRACAEEFLNPPIANLGNRGILTAAQRVRSLHARVPNPRRDLPAISTIMERAGTGGALFRNLYRDFLTEAHDMLSARPEATRIATARDGFARSAQLWTNVAHLIERAGASDEHHHLTHASDHLREIAAVETTAMTTLRSL